MQSIWDLYYEFMTIIFGVNHPAILDIVIFVVFLILVFGMLFLILSCIFSWIK
ncbi:hypothetical protein M1770_07340 [Spiroplasma citri]|uniref:hypothetical protein n=1 Tax=Spiroplasma citri TaxID=2133 RepID=UPI002412652A|nr:hypothetical protein [Spiroplasma citri]WFG97869.1 hypothetical protein M1770_07340 [Spiroplasma citri]